MCDNLQSYFYYYYYISDVAKNVIMFLGDGMSIPTLAAARMYLGSENHKLSFDEFPYTGLSMVSY